MTTSATAYDEFAYPGRVFSQSHPNRLAVLATMLGMTPAPPERCRVLEIGCGDALNLLALAQTAPESTFVGFDRTVKPIEFARGIADDVGLTNLQLFHADLMNYEPDAPFDYIIAHGFLSWVPEPVQQRLMAVCQRALAPQGVAFISYNAYPGFHARRMLREMMRFHAHGATDPRERIEKARGLMQFLLAGRRGDDEYVNLLTHESQWVLNRESDAVLLHDDLADVNIPFYIREFAAFAEQHGLQFLAEADFFEMNPRAFPPPVAEALLGLKDIILREQYIDFLKCRRFRQSLVVHRNVVIDREPRPERARAFYVTSTVEPASPEPDLQPGVIEAFDGPRSGALRLDHALSKAALLCLRDSFPRPLSFDELVAQARAKLGPDATITKDDEDVLTEVLSQLHFVGVGEFHMHRPHWVTEMSDRPVASPLIRAMLQRGCRIVATLRPITLVVDAAPYAAVMMLMDGTRDRASLEAELRRQIAAHEIEIPEGITAQQVDQLIEMIFARVTRDAVLVA